MGNYDGAVAAIILILAILYVIFAGFTIWVVSGFICNTLEWNKINDYAQLFVTAFIIILYSGATFRKS